MKNGQVKSFRDRIQESKTFQSWSPLVQKICMTRSFMKSIFDGMTIAGNIGYQKWESQTGMLYRNRELVKELLEENLNAKSKV